MTAFEDWKAKAQEADILSEAIARGAKLRRTGREHIGPCPACGGTDRFSVNPQKHIFNCRGAEGGDVIGLVMHIDGVSFTQACETLTGEPPPNGHSKPLSLSEQSERENRRAANEAAQRQRKAQEAIQNQDTIEFCAKIIGECVPLAGTLAEKYLHLFHLPTPPNGWPDCLMFHPALNYPGKGKMPALVARVDDVSGQMTGIWREFIRADGRKADLEFQKLGLGPVAGGAVRLGGIADHIGAAEGVRTSIGAWALIGFKHPVWACLSTAGLIGFELPLGVSRLTVFPDGDRPIKKQGEEYVPAVPAGRKAALALQSRAITEGVDAKIAAEPGPLLDYEKLWQAMAREVA